MNTNIRLCDHCEEQPIALKINATTADGILLDVLRLCAFCGAKWNRRADLEIGDLRSQEQRATDN